LVTKVYFPREILPATYILAALFDFIIGVSVLGVLLIWYRVPLGINAAYALPVMLILVMFSMAIALFASATQVRFRDIGLAIPLLLQIWMFATPVVYPMSVVPSRLCSLYVLNPMAGIIENFRRVILLGSPPDTASLYVSAAVSVSLLIASYIYFKRVEATMADVI
jgi:lipopolysaccharide transport system permease protein